MVLKALYDYYDRCKAYAPNSVPDFGWAEVSISFIITIEADGTFFKVEDARGELGKGTSYRLPSDGKSHTNAIKPFLFYDNCTYTLGFHKELCAQYLGEIKKWQETTDKEWKKLKEGNPSIQKTDRDKAKTAELNDLKTKLENEIIGQWKCSTEFSKHKAFVDLCKQIYEETKDAKFKAVCDFYDKGQLKQIWQDQAWKIIQKAPTANITFRVRGDDKVVAENPKLVNYIERDSQVEGVCVVTGTKGKIIRTATNTRINGCDSSASLMSFQINCGFDSDGKEQCYNAPISFEADFKISTALKKLISAESHNCFLLGDRTYVFFASSQNEDTEFVEESFFDMFNEEPTDNPDAGVLSVEKSFTSIFSGKKVIASDDKFYIIGIAPNKGREAVVYYSEQSLTDFVSHIKDHFDGMTLHNGKGKEPCYGINGILKTIFGKDKYIKGNYPKNLIDAMVKSIFQGLPYPYTLFSACIRRIRAESEGEIRIGRVAILKAYLNRINDNNKKMETKFDKNNTNPGYLCGRLFAVLDKIQEDANNVHSIRERYMNAASTTPATVFATILNLSTHHLENLPNEGWKVKYEKLKQEIIGKISADGFPPHLDLQDQGRFFIGYYHQRQDLFTSKDENNKDK